MAGHSWIIDRRKALILVLVFSLSMMLRYYYVDLWRTVPTSDPYHFIAWAEGMNSSKHLDFPGSEDRAYGQYPNGYPMFLLMLHEASGASLLTLTMYLPVLIGALCVFPVYQVFRRLVESRIACAIGSAMVVFSLAFTKYTSASIPNMLGLYLFALGIWLALGAGRTSKRILALTLVLVPVVARIHYLSLVCLGVVLAIVVARKVMISTIGTGESFDYRRLAFLLIVALVAGAAAWTAAYRIMRGLYGIDITQQPPARLSITLKLIGYPLVFGVLQTLALPLGVLGLIRIYLDVNFGKKAARVLMDPVLLFSLWLVFFVFALGFLQVEYYPFRFNCYLMIFFGMISLVGLLIVVQRMRERNSTRMLSRIALPGTLMLVFLQPLVVSKVSLGDQPFLPWEQEYGEPEMPVIEHWMRDNTLSIEANRSGEALLRIQMVMADWVRSRAMRAFGLQDVHLHWWAFQGWDDLNRRPNPWRSLDVYGGDIVEALGILGRLNMRQATDSVGDHYYYYKYLYTSDWIASIMRKDFGVEADVTKFDGYNGSLSYHFFPLASEDDKIATSNQKPPITAKAYPIRPFDKLYSSRGVGIYYFTPLKR